MLVYCPDYSRQSRLAPKFLADINNLCQRDYGKSFFPNSMICLDLDAYETSLTGNNDATTDAAVGIADYFNNQSSSCRHFLIELRFDYKSMRNIDLRNMRRKVSHSRALLAPERVHDYVAFMYTDQVAPIARSCFFRLAKEHSEIGRWKAMSVADLENYIVDSSTLPYQCENDLTALGVELQNKYVSEGLDGLDGLIEYWLGRMRQYNLHYKKAESDAVARKIVDVLNTIFPTGRAFEDEYIPLRIKEVELFYTKS